MGKCPGNTGMSRHETLQRRTIMILEDDEDRIRAFEGAVASLGPEFELRLWCDAPTMRSECPDCLASACLISLDHDLTPLPGITADPGNGLEVAEFLAQHQPRCPVILHTSNSDRRWSMHNELRFGGWIVEIVPPFGTNWIHESWLPRAKALIEL